MKKILTKVISLLTSAVISACVLFGTPLSEFKGMAAEVSAATIDEAYVQEKLAELKAAFSQTGTYKYFTSDGQQCCNDYLCYSGSNCPDKKCKLIASVLKNNPFAKSSGVASIITKNDRYSCYAFASFAFAYIFGVDTYGNIGSGSNQVTKTTYKISDSESLYSTLKPGDMLMYHNNGSNTHYVIFLGYDISTKTVHYYECNYNAGWKPKGACLVEYDNKRKFDFYLTRTDGGTKRSDVTVYHYNGYGTSQLGTHYIVDKNYSGSDPKNIRASKSTSSAILGTIPKNTVCWVTEISGSGSNMWGKVTYNGVTGYINLYYSVTTTDHQWSSWNTTKAATCTDSGTETRSCGCGKTEEKSIAATGHSYGSWQVTTNPTCTVEGTEQRTCSKCGNKETRLIAATGHTYKDETIAPTCTEGGYTKHTCTVCGHSYTDSNTAATGHTYKDETVPPTCTEEGYTKHICTKCGHSYSDNSTAALGHQYKDEKVAPTPTARGYTKHTCTACGHSYNDNYTPILCDLNDDGKITTVDAKWVLQAVSGSRTLTPEQEAAADVNVDGKITTVDAKWILQAVSGSRTF